MTNTLSLLIGSHPSSPFASTALALARSAMQKKIEIYRIFFHSQGVLNCSRKHENEFEIISAWQALALESKMDIICCANAVHDNDLKQDHLFNGAEIGGLTQLVDAQHHSSKIVSF